MKPIKRTVRDFRSEKALRTAEIENIINEIEQEGGE